MIKKTDRPLRAVIYVRLSSLRRDDPSLSPASQLESCRAQITAKKWTLAAEVQDEAGDPGVVYDLDQSGSDKGLRLDRPGLNVLRQHWGKFDVVVFAKLDRLARNVIDFRTFADEAASHGASLVSVHESLDLTTPVGRFVATILAAFAEMEAAAMSDRLLDSHDVRRKAGRWRGGVVPHGYHEITGADKASYLAINEHEAKPLRRAAELILSGKKLTRTVETINSEGLTTRSGGPWSIVGIKRALTSPATVGRVLHRGEPVLGDDGLPISAFPALIPLSDWHTIRDRLGVDNPDRKRGTNRASRLASGLLRCSDCGAVMTANGRGNTFRCSAPMGTCQTHPAMRAPLLETYLTDSLLAKFGHVEHYTVHDITEPDTRRADAITAKASLARRFTEPDADYGALVDQIRELDRLIASLPETTVRRREVRSGRPLHEVWESTTDVHDRRKLLGRYLHHATISPGTRGRKGLQPERVAIQWATLDDVMPVRLAGVVENVELYDPPPAGLPLAEPEPAPRRRKRRQD